MLFEPDTLPADAGEEQGRSRKLAGAFYTPDVVVETLVRWAVHDPTDRLLDPACGDGRFVALHANSVGCEREPSAASIAARRAPWAMIHNADFFTWAAATEDRFTCVAGNPPFIRYQSFNGEVRQRALALCSEIGVSFSGLSSSWAPFLVGAASRLTRGGRLAFVVPAEIGHAPYATPLLEFLVQRFAVVHVLAYKRKLFPELSEDCWLLYAEGFGGSTDEIRFTASERFEPSPRPPARFQSVSTSSWRHDWNRRLRPFLVPAPARDLYLAAAAHRETCRLGQLATVGIGYVTGANKFFHLRPSTADRHAIPSAFLLPSVRNGRALPPERLSHATVEEWHRRDEPALLLRILPAADLPKSVQDYLATEEGQIARRAYKCRVREPWYSVPDVQIPDYFLTYMSGAEPHLVRNDAGCSCTNSVHAVKLRPGRARVELLSRWRNPLVRLSCELEGHPLGGGMLKLEPREAARIVLPQATFGSADSNLIEYAITTLRHWRHHANAD